MTRRDRIIGAVYCAVVGAILATIAVHIEDTIGTLATALGVALTAVVLGALGRLVYERINRP
jgi:CDP-diglyceride synthetase